MPPTYASTVAAPSASSIVAAVSTCPAIAKEPNMFSTNLDDADSPEDVLYTILAQSLRTH